MNLLLKLCLHLRLHERFHLGTVARVQLILLLEEGELLREAQTRVQRGERAREDRLHNTSTANAVVSV